VDLDIKYLNCKLINGQSYYASNKFRSLEYDITVKSGFLQTGKNASDYKYWYPEKIKNHEPNIGLPIVEEYIKNLTDLRVLLGMDTESVHFDLKHDDFMILKDVMDEQISQLLGNLDDLPMANRFAMLRKRLREIDGT